MYTRVEMGFPWFLIIILAECCLINVHLGWYWYHLLCNGFTLFYRWKQQLYAITPNINSASSKGSYAFSRRNNIGVTSGSNCTITTQQQEKHLPHLYELIDAAPRTQRHMLHKPNNVKVACAWCFDARFCEVWPRTQSHFEDHCHGAKDIWHGGNNETCALCSNIYVFIYFISR